MEIALHKVSYNKMNCILKIQTNTLAIYLFSLRKVLSSKVHLWRTKIRTQLPEKVSHFPVFCHCFSF